MHKRPEHGAIDPRADCEYRAGYQAAYHGYEFGAFATGERNAPYRAGFDRGTDERTKVLDRLTDEVREKVLQGFFDMPAPDTSDP